MHMTITGGHDEAGRKRDLNVSTKRDQRTTSPDKRSTWAFFRKLLVGRDL